MHLESGNVYTLIANKCANRRKCIFALFFMKPASNSRSHVNVSVRIRTQGKHREAFSD